MCLLNEKKKTPASRKGAPRPKEYTANRTMPWSILPEVPARNRIDARMAPTHGAQPAPKAIPSKAAPNTPCRFFRRCRRFSKFNIFQKLNVPPVLFINREYSLSS
jgi:hypothetical protein